MRILKCLANWLFAYKFPPVVLTTVEVNSALKPRTTVLLNDKPVTSVGVATPLSAVNVSSVAISPKLGVILTVLTLKVPDEIFVETKFIVVKFDNEK